MNYKVYDSPVNTLLLLADQRGLVEIRFAGTSQKALAQVENDWEEGSALLDRCTEQLDAYFAGQLTRFDLPLVYSGTDFQQQVMHALCDKR